MAGRTIGAGRRIESRQLGVGGIGGHNYLALVALAFIALLAIAACSFPYEHAWLAGIDRKCEDRIYLAGDRAHRGLSPEERYAKYHDCLASELTGEIRGRLGASVRISAVEDLLVSEGFLCSGNRKDLRMWDETKNRRITCSILHQSTGPDLIPGRLRSGAYRWVVVVEEQKEAAPDIQSFVAPLHDREFHRGNKP